MDINLIIGILLILVTYLIFRFSTPVLEKSTERDASSGIKFLWRLLWLAMIVATISVGITSFILLQPYIEQGWEALATLVYKH